MNNNKIFIDKIVDSKWPRENVTPCNVYQDIEATDANGSFTFLSNFKSRRCVIVPFPELNEETGEKNTLEDFQVMMNNLENPCIQRELSSEPIISERHQIRISKGELTISQIKNRQIVKNSKGEPILDNFGQVQYRVLRLLPTYQPDIDNRRKLVEDVINEQNEQEDMLEKAA